MKKDAGKIAIVLAHPDMVKSRANKELIETVKELDAVVVYNLYEDFPELFDPEVWTQIMNDASALVFQFPLYWMSAPYKLKKWQEEVFTHLSRTPGVTGKPLMVVTTAGSSFDYYRSGGVNGFTIDEILRPYQASALNAGMKWQTPVVVYSMAEETIGKNLTEGALLYKDKLLKIMETNNGKTASDW